MLGAAVAQVAHAEDAKAKAAREELERELNQMVGKPPTKVRVEYVPVDDPNYKLEDAQFELDGRTLTRPALTELEADGTHLVWSGDVTPGKHDVKARLVFANGTSAVLSDEGGYKWKIAGDVSFEQQAGIEVRVQVVPTRDAKQPDVAKRFRLSLPAQPVMLARLEDGKMPEAPKANLPVVVDAGAVAAAPAVIDAGVKVAVAEPPPPTPEAAPTVDAPPPSNAPRRDAPVPTGPAVLTQVAADAGPVAAAQVAEVIDAGAPAVVAEVPPAPVEPMEEGTPWWIWAVGGVAVLAILFFVLARRSGRPPTLDD